MRWPKCAYCLFMFLPSVVDAYKEVRKGFYSFMKDTRLVAEATLYIPLGHHAKIECPFDHYATHVDKKEEIEFSIGPVGEPASVLNMTKNGDEWMRNRLYVYKNVIYLHGMSRKFDNFLIDCIARGRENSTTTKHIALKSTVRLVSQNCSEGDKYSKRSFNEMNPCRYGSCRVKNDDGYELLECRCLPEYTGLYCNVLVDGAIFYESLYYWPVIFYVTIVPLAFALYFWYIEKCKKGPRLFAIGDHVPLNNRSVDLRKLYPVKFMTHEEYTEKLLSLDKVEPEPSKSKEANQCPQGHFESKVLAESGYLRKLKSRRQKQASPAHSEISVEPDLQHESKGGLNQVGSTRSDLGELSFDVTKVTETVREGARMIESLKRKIKQPPSMFREQRKQEKHAQLPKEPKQIETPLLQKTPLSKSCEESESGVIDSTQVTGRSIRSTEKTQ